MAFHKTKHPGVSVFRRGELGYYARWFDHREQRYKEVAFKTIGCTTKRAAEEWLARKSQSVKESKERFGRLQVDRTPWSSVVEAFRTHFRSSHTEDRTTFAIHALARFIDLHGDDMAFKFSVRDLWKFRDALSDVTPQARNRYLGALRVLLKWARRNEIVLLTSDEITDGCASFRVERKLPRVLSPNEVNRLFLAAKELDDEFDAKVSPYITIALLTGMRPGEIDAMKWGDVDLVRKEIRVWGNKTQVERLVPIHDSPKLMKFLKARKGDKAAFVLDGLDKITRKTFERLVVKASLPGLHRNDLRKTCISAVASGSAYSEFLLEARFGHAKDVSIRHYREARHGAKGKTVEEWLGMT